MTQYILTKHFAKAIVIEAENETSALQYASYVQFKKWDIEHETNFDVVEVPSSITKHEAIKLADRMLTSI
jgi:hypothetical protein